MSNRKNAPPPPRASAHDWMTPVDGDQPCGPDLEYDPEFVVLSSKVAARSEAQYGDFIGSPEPVNWGDVDRDCRRLMMRSKDMRIAVLFTRCRTRLAGAAGLAEGVGVLAAWLAAFPEALHPQPGVDADRDAALEIRMNALQSLADADGLLADVREIALTKSTAMRLQVRDVERAFAYPRPGDALAPESVARQLENLREQQPGALAGFDEALAGLEAVEAWSREHLGAYAPDFTPLHRLLRHLAAPDGLVATRRARASVDDDLPFIDAAAGASDETSAQPEGDDAPSAPAPHVCAPAKGAQPLNRHDALDLIRAARHWFEQHEPSSPIPLLLQRAERCVGKRYADVVHAIPADLLAQWMNDET